jgi:hypothetical protein
MGNCVRNFNKPGIPSVVLNKSKSSELYKLFTQDKKPEEEEKKHLNVDQVFEDIQDIKDLQIKGIVLLSESFGKPKDYYDTLSNIAQCKYIILLRSF